MAITRTWGYTDTASPTSRNITPQDLVFTQNFRVTKPRGSKNEIVLANLFSPMDRVETIRFGSEPIANIYNGTGLDPSVQSQNKRGTAILAQVHETIKVVDSDLQEAIVYPLSAHLVIKMPMSEAIYASDALTLITRLLGSLYEDSESSPNDRIRALLRGSVIPKGIA